MPDYSIFTLGESQISVSGGGQLDGVTQGDGSNLVGLEITLNSNAWEEVLITDNDPNFQDSDGSQRLNGSQTIDGVTYANGTRVEAEYAVTLSDGANTWTAIGFNVNNSSPAYGTIEGLAFIGGPGGFPPIGVPLTVVGSQEGPSFDAAFYATPICYAAGTLIDTETGPKLVETLTVADRVRTLDHGFRPLLWAGGRHVIAAGRFAPVEIPAGVLGLRAPLRVSQQHRILMTGPLAELMFGAAEVFVPALSLLGAGGARLIEGGACAYHHLVLDQHEVVFANGLASESLFLADAADADGEAGDLRRFFPELQDVIPADNQLARPALRRQEADLLVRLMAERDTGQLRAAA